MAQVERGVCFIINLGLFPADGIAIAELLGARASVIDLRDDTFSWRMYSFEDLEERMVEDLNNLIGIPMPRRFQIPPIGS